MVTAGATVLEPRVLPARPDGGSAPPHCPPCDAFCRLEMFFLTCSPCSSNFLMLPSSRLLRARVHIAAVRGNAGSHVGRRLCGQLPRRVRGAGAHMSLLMNSTRFVTLFFTSMSSCLTSTGPISLNTLASSSRRSSSCVRNTKAHIRWGAAQIRCTRRWAPWWRAWQSATESEQ